MFVIVAALKSEITPFLNHFRIISKSTLGSGTLYETEKIHFLRVGIGGQNAASNLGLYLKIYMPSEIVNIGFAGNMSGFRLRSSIFSMAEVRNDVNKKRYSLSAFAQNNFTEANLLTVDQPLKDAQIRDALYKKYKTKLVDMEAWYLADCTAKNNIPFSCIKIVSDEADQFTEQVFMANYQKLSIRLAESILPLIQKKCNEQ